MKRAARLATVSLVALLPGCAPQSVSRLEIQSKLDAKIVVTKVTGIGFSPFPDPSEPTNSIVCGPIGKAHLSHSAPGRIVVHTSAAITYRDSAGVVHSPKVRIIKAQPDQRDFGEVTIVIQEPEEVIVLAGG
jgi:hypothetical protein